MCLFPNEDTLTKEEIESWKSFVDNLSSEEDRELFEKMLNDYYNYAAAINATGEPFPTEPLIMTLLLSQRKIIISFSINGLQKIPKYFILLKNLASCCHCNYSISKNTL
jgi:SNF2 family DNA or RNA helicase